MFFRNITVCLQFLGVLNSIVKTMRWGRAMRKRYKIWVLCISLLLFISACGDQNNANNNDESNNETNNELTNESDDENIEDDIEDEQKETTSAPVDVELLTYGEELGLTLEPPMNELATEMVLKGEVEKTDNLNEEMIWVEIWKDDQIEEITKQEFNYFIPIENGSFEKNLNLYHGEGEYYVTVRLPSEDETEEDQFYDAAEFMVENTDDDIKRDVEFSKYGIAKDLQLSEGISGWNTAEKMFELNGRVDEDYNGESIFAEIEKDGESHTVTMPIRDGHFTGDIPLNYGAGVHEITLQLEIDDDAEKEGMYYDSAFLYVDNESDEQMSEFTEYADYIDSGLILDEPSREVETELSDIEYPIKGRIDADAPLADDVNYIIVSIEHLEDYDESTYYIPVEDYEFEETAHFRFGPGEYEVTFHIPEPDQEEGPRFYYQSVLSVNHTLESIDDKRDILPSRGTESDDPEIIEKAEEITEGLDSEREKAKAIYEYVAKHVDYDVEKYEKDIFNPDDSAIATLESGLGICQDYTFLTTALLRSIGIESRYIEGYAGDRHAWVEAKVDGDWIELDPTWGAGYVDGDQFVAEYNEDYFDPDKEMLAETHSRDDIMY